MAIIDDPKILNGYKTAGLFEKPCLWSGSHDKSAFRIYERGIMGRKLRKRLILSKKLEDRSINL